jgi:hypothetical protein
VAAYRQMNGSGGGEDKMQEERDPFIAALMGQWMGWLRRATDGMPERSTHVCHA